MEELPPLHCIALVPDLMWRKYANINCPNSMQPHKTLNRILELKCELWVIDAAISEPVTCIEPILISKTSLMTIPKMTTHLVKQLPRVLNFLDMAHAIVCTIKCPDKCPKCIAHRGIARSQIRSVHVWSLEPLKVSISVTLLTYSF